MNKRELDEGLTTLSNAILQKPKAEKPLMLDFDRVYMEIELSLCRYLHLVPPDIQPTRGNLDLTYRDVLPYIEVGLEAEELFRQLRSNLEREFPALSTRA